MKQKTKFIAITLVITLLLSVSLALIYIQKNKNHLEAKKETPIIKIGAILPLTGSASVVGEQIQKAMNLANEKNKYTIIYEDSANTPSKGVNAYNKLSQIDKVNTVIVAMTGVSKAIVPFASRDKLATFAISTSVPIATSSKDYVFRYFIDGVSEAESMAEYLVGFGHKKIAVVKINDEYGNVMFDSFKKKLETKGIQPLLVESFERDVANFRLEAAKIKAGNPDSIYFIGYSKPLATVIKQSYEVGLKVPYASTFGFEIPGTRELAGEAANGLVYTSVKFGENIETTKEFFEKFKKTTGQNPSNDAAFAYDLVNSLPLLISNGALKNPNSFVGSSISSQFGKITFNDRLEASVPIIIKKVSDNGAPSIVN